MSQELLRVSDPFFQLKQWGFPRRFFLQLKQGAGDDTEPNSPWTTVQGGDDHQDAEEFLQRTRRLAAEKWRVLFLSA